MHRLRARVAGPAVVGAMLIAAACGGSSSDSSPATSAATPSTATTSTSAPESASSTSAPDDASTTTATPELAPVVVEVVGPEEVVFDYSEQACGDYQRPDLPARAFRSADGTVNVVMSAPDNTRLVGPSLDELAVACEVVRTSAYDHDPAAHAHFEWIGALYTEDGNTVHAVIHNEFHGWESALADSRRAILHDYGDEGWAYLARTPGGLVDMAPAESGFQLGDTLCAIDFWGAHPDVGCDAVRRYTAPVDGRYVIDVRANRASSDGDGVLVTVERSGAPLLSTELDGSAELQERLDLELVAGETIDFVVAAGADASFDGTEFEVVITPDGAVCAGDIWGCTQVELTAAVSTDGGTTFGPAQGAGGVIASPAEPYRHDAGLLAFWQPSNIVQHPTDGHYYMLSQFDDARNGRNIQFTCLLRTDDLADPASWRAFDGDGFNLTFAGSPYGEPTPDPDDCWSVVAPPTSGLTWNTHLERFVAVGGYGQFGANGQYLTTSTDLIEWTSPVFIQPAEFVFTSDTPPFEPYATLIDPASESMSFDTTGARPYLYFTRINDMSTLDFDLVRVPLRLDVESSSE
ncbi:MAG: hypothetical protein AAFY28_04650 [Actinomycetota bacterium]